MSQYLVEFNRSYLDVYNLCASAFSVSRNCNITFSSATSLAVVNYERRRQKHYSVTHTQTDVCIETDSLTLYSPSVISNSIITVSPTVAKSDSESVW